MYLYNVVHTMLFPHTFTQIDDDLSVDTLREVERWCVENLGPLSTHRWYRDTWSFQIYDADDALAFRMRWS